MPDTPEHPQPTRLRADFHRAALNNGAVLLWSRSEDSRSVALRGSFPAGSFREDPGRGGLAAFTARLLRRGTRRHGAQEISARVEEIGASFSIWAGTEETGFSAKCLERDVPAVLDVLREVLEEPAFQEAEIGKVRGELLTELEELEDSPRGRADRSLSGMLYPDHPYGRPTLGSRESVAALGRADFQEFHHRFYSAAGLKLAIAGPVDPDAVRRHVESWLPGRPGEPVPDGLRARASSGAGRERIPLPHKSQVVILMGGPGIPRDHPDYFPLAMVNMILGSLGLMGRLGERVRDRHGMAYSVWSRSHSRLWSGEWMAGAGVSPGNEDRTVELILDEVRRVREEPVTEEEWSDARANLIGSMPLRMETHDGLASYLLGAEYYNLGLDYVERYPDLVNRVTPESMQEAARAHMDPAGFSIVMAGPVSGGSEPSHAPVSS